MWLDDSTCCNMGCNMDWRTTTMKQHITMIQLDWYVRMMLPAMKCKPYHDTTKHLQISVFFSVKDAKQAQVQGVSQAWQMGLSLIKFSVTLQLTIRYCTEWCGLHSSHSDLGWGTVYSESLWPNQHEGMSLCGVAKSSAVAGRNCGVHNICQSGTRSLPRNWRMLSPDPRILWTLNTKKCVRRCCGALPSQICA